MILHRISVLKNIYRIAGILGGLGAFITAIATLVSFIKSDSAQDESSITPTANKDTNAAVWSARLHNIDDTGFVYVNGIKVIECGFGDNCPAKIDAHLSPGKNEIRISVINSQKGWTYGYDILKNDKIVFTGKCGVSGVVGCNYDDRTLGEVYSVSYVIDNYSAF